MKVLNIVLMLLLLILFSSVGSASEPGTDDKPESAAGQDSSEVSAEASADTESGSQEEVQATVMDQPLDGSSVEAFTAGLSLVDEQATEKQYRNLMSALDYLLFYDLGAKRDKAKLYDRLDGKSPNQILTAVADTRGDKHRR